MGVGVENFQLQVGGKVGKDGGKIENFDRFAQKNNFFFENFTDFYQNFEKKSKILTKGRKVGFWGSESRVLGVEKSSFGGKIH